MNDDKTIDLASIRARLASTEGKRYWQSLEELADSPSFKALVQREFPTQASEWLDPKGRRGFLKLMGASIALAGATACTRQPDELIVPYVRQPEEVVPGRPLFFATAMTLGGIATGLLAESHVGRPTKLEGNPEHPSSLGATDLLAQASILTMYDPDRTRAITYLGRGAPLGQLHRRHADGAGRSEGAWRHRPPLPQRDHDVADAGRAVCRCPRGDSRRQVAPVRPGLARRRAPGRAARLRRAGARPLQARSGPGHRRARRGPVWRRHAGQRPLRARLRIGPPRAPREGRDEPPLRRRADADVHRIGGRSSPAAQGQPGGRGRARHSCRRTGRHARHARLEGDRRLCRRRGEGSAGRARQGRRGGRRASAGSGTRRRARDQSGARQHRHDGHRHRPARRRMSSQIDGLKSLVAGSQRRHRAPAGDPRRQPGLQCAGGPQVRRGAAQGADARARRALRRRDGGAVPLARQRHALPRGVERRARARRHRLDRAAAHRAALSRQVVPRGRRGVQRPARAQRLRPGPRVLAGAAGVCRRTCSRRPGARPCTTA